MPKYTVTVNRTRTIESSFFIEVTAKDEESAEAKVQEKLDKAQQYKDGPEKGLDAAFDWNEDSTSDEFEFDISEV